MIPTPPDAILLQLGPIAVRWYGLLYAVGLLVAYRFMVREAHRRKLNAELIATGLVVVSIAADTFKAYGVAGLRHQPEIRQGLCLAFALAGNVDLKALGDVPLPLLPHHRVELSLHMTLPPCQHAWA